MLSLPESIIEGFGDGGKTASYADWVEASTLMCAERISTADVRDYFYEENTFRRGGSDETVSDIWSELERRKRILKDNMPLDIQNNRIIRQKNWFDCPAYTFCLLISYAKANRLWQKEYASDYNIQGEIFEKISCDALDTLLERWQSKHVGWHHNRKADLNEIIANICHVTGLSQGRDTPDIEDKDGGVDILCYRTFSDKRANNPMFFVQCATGNNWHEKRSPDPRGLWQSWINLPTNELIARALIVPFSLHNELFIKTAKLVRGLVIDRLRLFDHVNPETKWLSKPTLRVLKCWLRDKIITLEGIDKSLITNEKN